MLRARSAPRAIEYRLETHAGVGVVAYIVPDDNTILTGNPEIIARTIVSPGFIKQAKDFAAELGGNRGTCCPPGYGFEFPFQTDVSRAWGYPEEAFGEGAAHRPDIVLHIEYKLKETRRHCFLARATVALVLIGRIGVKNLGVTMDYDHSVLAGEHPAETMTLLHNSGLPYYIHINDNDKSWDWDFFIGSHTLLEYLEFVYWAKQLGYNDYMTADTYPQPGGT
jgi:xylose isomerase